MKLTTSITALLLTVGVMAQPQLTKDNIHEVVAAMTLEEKVSLVVGVGPDNLIQESAGRTCEIERLGVAPVVLADGPAGLRIKPIREGEKGTFHCTSFPVGTAMSSTWNVDLANKVGKAIGSEVREYGVDVILGPGLNIQRNPLCGRNFEYYSEDPFLTGLVGAAVVNGIESNDVGACIKHFAANNQETNRWESDSRVSVRALREIYLKGFEIAVKNAQPWMVMSSYNKLNGRYTSVNRGLLHDILRCEWGYEGAVITDWGFIGIPPQNQIKAENDLMMDGCPQQKELLIAAVKSGELPESQLDICVMRILEIAAKSCRAKKYEYSDKPDLKASAKVALEAALESIVLLENHNSTLPLSSSIKKIALFGNGSYDFLEGGTGSGEVHEPYIISPADGFTNKGFKVNKEIETAYRTYIKEAVQQDLEKNGPRHWFWGRFHPAEMELDISQINDAAKVSDAAVITFSRQAGEAGDRFARKGDFELSDSERLMLDNITSAFHERGKKVVVVLNVGSPMEISSWKDIPDAILISWQCGQEGGNALADIVTGKVTPSGKVPATFPIAYSDLPSAEYYPGEHRNFGDKNFDYTEYAEGIYVGYRHFDKANEPVCYPFGYGLSYTEFEYSNMTVCKSGYDYVVSVTIKNIGKRPGKEAVQLYISAPSSELDKPIKELKSFAKTDTLAPGDSQEVSMTFSAYDLASFDESRKMWVTSNGVYNAVVGASSQDVRLTKTFPVITEMTWPVHDVLNKASSK